MARKYWIILGTLVVLFIVGAAAAGIGYWQYRAYQVRNWLATADQAYEKEDWREAKKNYRMYLARNTTDQDVLLKYADATSRVEQNRGVILADMARVYYQLADAFPDNEEYLLRLMEVENNRSNWTDLEYYSDFFLDVRPGDPMLQYYHAYALDRLGRADDAIEAYNEIIESGDIYRKDIYGYLSGIYAARDLNEQARRILEEALEASPDDPELKAQWALYLLRTDGPDAAATPMDEALNLAPGNPDVLIPAMQIAMARQDWDTAIERGKKAVEMGAKNPLAYTLLADAYQFNSHIDDAIALIEGLDPLYRADHPEFFLLYAELLFRADRHEDAREWAEYYRQIYPSHRMAHDYLEARLLLIDGNAVSAASKLTTVVETSPSFRQAQLYLVASHLQLQDRATARALLETYIANFPEDTQATTLYDREFGDTQTLDSTLQVARRLLDDENATADMLRATATELYNKSASTGEKETYFDRIVELARAALRKQPDSETTYAVLIETYANSDRIDEAEKTLAEAEQAGISLDNLRMVRAVVAAVKSEEDSAFALYEEELKSQTVTVDTVVRWASFFNQRISLEAGNRAFDIGKPYLPEETRSVLTLEQLDLLARANKPREARALIESLDINEDTPPDVVESIIEKRMAIVRDFLRPGDNRDLEAARAEFEALRDDRPEDISVKLLEAEILLVDDEDNLTEADRIVTECLAADPFNQDGLLLAARIAESEGDVSSALSLVEQAVNSGDSSVRDYHFLARMQLAADREDDAIESLETARRLDPNEPNVLRLLIETLRATGRVNRALSLYDELAALAPDTDDSKRTLELLRARLNIEGGRSLAEAEQSLRSALETDPGNLRIAGDLARALVEQKRIDEATSFLERFVDSIDDDPGAWVLLARHYLNLPDRPDLAKARTAVTQATIIDRNFLPAIRTLIDISLRTNNIAQALALCDRFLTQQPNAHAILFQKGRLHLIRGENDAALEALNRSITLESSPEKLSERGEALLALGQYQEAIEDYQEVGRIGGATSPRVQLGLAEAWLALGNTGQAQTYRDQANNRMAPNDPLRRDARWIQLNEDLEAAATGAQDAAV